MNIGDRVRVKTSLTVYHHPEHRGVGFDMVGMEGQITGTVADPTGRPISANYPMIVKFGDKFIVHLSDAEVEPIT